MNFKGIETKVKYLPDEWRTFDGRTVSFKTVDHQHLSNTYWFMKIYWESVDAQLWQILEEIQNRFEGVVLPYRPRADFYGEIAFLKRKGMIGPHAKIFWNGEEIGEILPQISN
jgi:hypothetical protein